MYDHSVNVLTRSVVLTEHPCLMSLIALVISYQQIVILVKREGSDGQVRVEEFD